MRKDPSLIDASVGLLEELLASRKDVFDLTLVPDASGLITSFNSRQLAFFCRILALLVFEQEERSNAENLKIQQSKDLLQWRLTKASFRLLSLLSHMTNLTSLVHAYTGKSAMCIVTTHCFLVSKTSSLV